MVSTGRNTDLVGRTAVEALLASNLLGRPDRHCANSGVMSGWVALGKSSLQRPGERYIACPIIFY